MNDFDYDCAQKKRTARGAFAHISRKRGGYTIELNNGYFRDAVGYLKEYEQEDMNISLFDLMEETK